MLATYLTAPELAAQCLRDDPSFAALAPAEQRAEARAALRLIEGCDADDIDLQLQTIALACEPVASAGAARIVDTGRKKIVVAAPASAAPAPVARPEAARLEGVEDLAAVPVLVERADRVDFVPQACRNPDGCVETIAATGRCLQCGAQRKKPKGEAVLRPEVGGPARRSDPALNPLPAKSPKAQRITKRTKLNLTAAPTPEGFARRRNELAKGSILHRVKALTNAPDHYLARIINRSRASIQAYLKERIVFTADRWQLQQMQQLLLQQRLMLDDALDTIEAALEETR